MIPERDCCDKIAIVIAFNSLYKDVDITTASLLETDNKTIDQIQSILQSKKDKNVSKWATWKGTSNLTMTFKDKRPKRKVNIDNEC